MSGEDMPQEEVTTKNVFAPTIYIIVSFRPSHYIRHKRQKRGD